jgi:hypothetical protein
MRIEMVDSTIILPVADIQHFAFDYVNEAEQDTTVYIPNEPIADTAACIFAVDIQSDIAIEEAIFVDATGQQSKLQIQKMQEGRYLIQK